MFGQALCLLVFVGIMREGFGEIVALHSTQQTLAQAQAQMSADTLQAKAMGFALKAHPELWNYTLVQMNSSINRGSQSYADNLFDFLFELDSPPNKIIAMVTLSVTHNEQFISISPLVITVSQDQPKRPLGDYWISRTLLNYSFNSITNQTISSDLVKKIKGPSSYDKSPPPPSPLAPGDKSMKNAPLDGYTQYTNMQDPLLQFALDYVASWHPNIVNYQIDDVYYQIVAGVNIKIVYEGLDKFTTITAIVNFDLKTNPKILLFQVDCQEKKSQCSPSTAAAVYNAIQAVILTHPELFSFRVMGFLEESQSKDQTLVMVTFENKSLGLRTLTELSISESKITVLSFFTYSYAP